MIKLLGSFKRCQALLEENSWDVSFSNCFIAVFATAYQFRNRLQFVVFVNFWSCIISFEISKVHLKGFLLRPYFSLGLTKCFLKTFYFLWVWVFQVSSGMGSCCYFVFRKRNDLVCATESGWFHLQMQVRSLLGNVLLKSYWLGYQFTFVTTSSC